MSISRKAANLSLTGGWVIKSFASQPADCPPLSGEEMYKWAVALLILLSGIWLLEIFSKAEASPSGYLVKRAPEASARNSRFREIANWISLAIIGVRMAKIIQTSIIII